MTRGAVNINVEENPYEAVRDIVLPDKDGSTMRQDIRIPLLGEYIHVCKKYDKTCVLELKNAFTRAEIREIVAIIREYDYLDKVIFISFVLTNCLTSELMKTLVEQRLGLDSYYKVLTQEVIDALHAADLEVNCWTVDDPEWAEKLVAMGVDYITTNILE